MAYISHSDTTSCSWGQGRRISDTMHALIYENQLCDFAILYAVQVVDRIPHHYSSSICTRRKQVGMMKQSQNFKIFQNYCSCWFLPRNLPNKVSVYYYVGPIAHHGPPNSRTPPCHWPQSRHIQHEFAKVNFHYYFFYLKTVPNISWKWAFPEQCIFRQKCLLSGQGYT